MNQRDQSYAKWLGLIGGLFLIVAAILDYWPASSPIPWVSLEEARGLAPGQNKPIFVDVYAEWCGPCKMMDKIVFPEDSVQTILKTRFIPAKADGDQPSIGDTLRRQFGIRAYPTYIVLSPTGKERKRYVGFLAKSDFIKWLNDPVGVQILMWPELNEAVHLAQEQTKGVMVLVLQSGEDIESVNRTFEEQKTGEVLAKYFVPTLLVRGNLGEDVFLDAVGATPNTTMPEIIVLENNRKEKGRFFITSQMEYSSLAIANKLQELGSK